MGSRLGPNLAFDIWPWTLEVRQAQLWLKDDPPSQRFHLRQAYDPTSRRDDKPGRQRRAH